MSRAQIVENGDNISAIVYPNQHRKWVSLPAQVHLEHANALRKLREQCVKTVERTLQGMYTREQAVTVINKQFQTIQDTVLSW
jgi:D-aminopeptidase